MGHLVEREVDEWVAAYRSKLIQQRLKPIGWISLNKPSEVKADICIVPPLPRHEYTQKLIDYLQENGYEPIESQFCVGNMKANIGFKFDLITKKKKDSLGSNGLTKIQLWEAKYGYNENFDRKFRDTVSERRDYPERWLAGDLSELDANCLNFGLIEVHMGYELFTWYAKNEVDEVNLIHVSDRAKPEVYRTPQWMVDKGFPWIKKVLQERKDSSKIKQAAREQKAMDREFARLTKKYKVKGRLSDRAPPPRSEGLLVQGPEEQPILPESISNKRRQSVSRIDPASMPEKKERVSSQHPSSGPLDRFVAKGERGSTLSAVSITEATFRDPPITPGGVSLSMRSVVLDLTSE
jgi:hypothetical protein